jgi:hypothetical protein
VTTLISFVMPPTPGTAETVAKAASLSDWRLTSPLRVSQRAETRTSTRS